MATLFVVSGLVLLAHPWWTGIEERAGQRQLARGFNVTAAVRGAPAATRAAGTVSAAPATAVPAPTAKPRPRPAGLWRPPGPQPPVYARLSIPVIGLKSYVVNGATLTDYYDLLAWGPAHLRGSPRPGGAGNTVIFGHVDEFGSPFRHLDRLKKGDLVVLTAGGRRYAYKVMRIWSVVPTDTAVAAPIPGAHDLTLFTCSGIANTRRLVVRASLAGSAAVA